MSSLIANLPVQNRQAREETAEYVVPVGMTGYIRVELFVDAADLNDPLNSVRIRVEAIMPIWNETTQTFVMTWVPLGGLNWKGGTTSAGERIMLGVNLDTYGGLQGRTLRGSMVPSQRFRYGIRVENVASMFEPSVT